jgi:hypothetical protein
MPETSPTGGGGNGVCHRSLERAGLTVVCGGYTQLRFVKLFLGRQANRAQAQLAERCWSCGTSGRFARAFYEKDWT